MKNISHKMSPLYGLMACVLLAIAAAAQTSTTAQPNAAADTPGLEEARQLNAKVVQLYRQNKFDEALPLAKRVLELREKELGKEHQLIAVSLINLGEVYRAKRQYSEAKDVFQQALKIEEKRLGAEHPELSSLLLKVGWTQHVLAQASAAEATFKRAIAIKEKQRGNEHPEVAELLANLALFYQKIGAPKRALPLYERVITIREKAPGKEQQDLIGALEQQACALDQTGNWAEGRAAWERAREITNSVKGEPAALSGGVLQGKAIHRVQPAYPPAAKAERLSGTVLIKVVIDEAGLVTEAKVLCGPDLLAADSLAAARKWRFQPTELNGVPVKVQGVLTFNFTLQ
jgi:TonB family protein